MESRDWAKEAVMPRHCPAASACDADGNEADGKEAVGKEADGKGAKVEAEFEPVLEEAECRAPVSVAGKLDDKPKRRFMKCVDRGEAVAGAEGRVERPE